MGVVLVVVISAILVGITIFGVLKVVKHFSPPEIIINKDKDYNEVNGSETKNS
jgi:hypothetical protein